LELACQRIFALNKPWLSGTIRWQASSYKFKGKLFVQLIVHRNTDTCPPVGACLQANRGLRPSRLSSKIAVSAPA
jgi:hypothetical protein